MIVTDLHVHPTPWRHGQGAFHSFAEAAVRRGVDILGFAEHGPPPDPDPRFRGLEESEIAQYVQQVEEIKQELKGQIQVFCGLELDYQPEKLKLHDEIKKNYPLDYFLVSVHIIDDWYVDDPESVASSMHGQKELSELYHLYYQRVLEAGQTGLFEGFAHLDYVRRSLPHPPGNPPDFTRDLFPSVAEEISRMGVAVEINTRGLTRERMREVHPTRSLLKQLVRSGARFIMGSDAHELERIGEGLKEARNILTAEGVDSVCYFKKGQILEVEI